jgi:hypothetical protein
MSFIKFPEQRSAEALEKINGSEGLDRQNALSPSTASEYELVRAGGRMAQHSILTATAAAWSSLRYVSEKPRKMPIFASTARLL